MEEMPGCELVKFNIQVDQVHIVMIIPPKYSVSEVIGRLKQRTASEIRKKFAWLGRWYWRENVVWSPGFFVSAIGVERERILKYWSIKSARIQVKRSLSYKVPRSLLVGI